MNIFIASEEDLDGINKIRSAVTADETSKHNLTVVDKFEIEHSEERVTFICRIPSRIIGYLTNYKTNLFSKEQDVMLDMFVHPNYQGQGIGKKLIEGCVEHVTIATNFNRITLGVLHSNKGAIALYEKHGFKVIRADALGQYMALNVQR